MDYGMFLPIQKAAIAAITGDQSCGFDEGGMRDGATICATDLHHRLEDGETGGTMFVWAPIPAGFTDSLGL